MMLPASIGCIKSYFKIILMLHDTVLKLNVLKQNKRRVHTTTKMAIDILIIMKSRKDMTFFISLPSIVSFHT